MLSFIVDSVLVVLCVGGVVSGEVWLWIHRLGEDTRVTQEITAGTSAYRQERIAADLRKALTEEDAAFLRKHGWVPPVSLRGLAATVQPDPELGLKAIAPPQASQPPPKPDYYVRSGVGAPEIYDARGRKVTFDYTDGNDTIKIRRNQ